jgi:hypothetical protein
MLDCTLRRKLSYRQMRQQDSKLRRMLESELLKESSNA